MGRDNDELTLFKKEIEELSSKKDEARKKTINLENDKNNLNNELIEKKIILEGDLKKLYESKQNIKNKEEKIINYSNDIKRIKGDIEAYSET